MDLTMALYYVLDQVAFLERFNVNLIFYFSDLARTGISDKNKLGSFREAFEFVETGMTVPEDIMVPQIDKIIGKNIFRTRQEYEDKFIFLMKSAMIGLLEPQENLLDHFGRQKTIQDIEKLCNTYRKLLEKIIPKYTYYFHREFFEDEF